MHLNELETQGLVPYISPNGRLIVGVTYGGLKIFSSSDGTPLDWLRTDKLAVLDAGAKWTRDGRSLTYPVYRENSVNVWVPPVSGLVPRPLTNFPMAMIVIVIGPASFARLRWSPPT